MTIKEIQEKILFLKKEKNFAILAHAYQSREIIEIADIVGDSFKLAQSAMEIPEQNIILCGVRFMAETAKCLNPEKRVWTANENAGCPMAEQINPGLLASERKKCPDYTVVAYINTTAELKKQCDICVTSSSAVEIVKNIKNNKILFLPDPQLGSFVQKACPEKTFKFLGNGCPIHTAVTAEETKTIKEKYPEALLVVHPECLPEVCEIADYVDSTSGIIDFVKKSSAKEYIIGTEISIVEHLHFECPDKIVHPLSKKLICPDMKLVSLFDILNILGGKNSRNNEILMSEKEISDSRKCIDQMLKGCLN